MFKVISQFSPFSPLKTWLARNPTSNWLKNYKRILLRLTVTVFLVGLLSRLNVNWLQIGNDLSQANLLAIAGSIVLIFPIIGLKAWRWNNILKNYNIKLPHKEAGSLYGLGLLAGSVTPGQAGDFIKAFSLQERGHSLAKGLASTLVDRLYDMFVLTLLALLGLFQFGNLFMGELPILLGFLGLTGLGILALVIPRFSKFIFNDLPLKLLARKLKNRKEWLPVQTGKNQDDTLNFHHQFELKCIGSSFILTLLTAGLAVARCWLLALALVVNLPIMQAVAISSLATIAGLLPVTISGVGMRDLALIGLMSQLGYPGDTAVSLSTLLLFVNLFNFVAGYFVWFAFRSSNNTHPLKFLFKAR